MKMLDNIEENVAESTDIKTFCSELIIIINTYSGMC